MVLFNKLQQLWWVNTGSAETGLVRNACLFKQPFKDYAVFAAGKAYTHGIALSDAAYFSDGFSDIIPIHR